MAQMNYYDVLMNEFKKQLNRELCEEELEFISWVSEKYDEEMYKIKKSS